MLVLKKYKRKVKNNTMRDFYIVNHRLIVGIERYAYLPATHLLDVVIDLYCTTRGGLLFFFKNIVFSLRGGEFSERV